MAFSFPAANNAFFSFFFYLERGYLWPRIPSCFLGLNFYLWKTLGARHADGSRARRARTLFLRNIDWRKLTVQNLSSRELRRPTSWARFRLQSTAKPATTRRCLCWKLACAVMIPDIWDRIMPSSNQIYEISFDANVTWSCCFVLFQTETYLEDRCSCPLCGVSACPPTILRDDLKDLGYLMFLKRNPEHCH